ncbi:Spore coat protein CotS [Candidatus Arthromitus sp. SFB-4]|nr:Spore coat protein CotS [Candidatus Arthromitus sp. SFB-4]
MGENVIFLNIDDVNNSAKVLANLHISSKGYDPPEHSKLKSDLDRWPSIMDKRIRSFDKMRDLVRKKGLKNDVDMIYIKNYEFYKDIAKKAYNIFEKSNYYDICREIENEKSFCHHDYTHHNIVIDKHDNINILDFDYCKREVRSYDIANYIIRVLKKNNWDINICKSIIESYNSNLELRYEDIFLIYGFLLFPQRFWRVCNRYFYNDVLIRQNVFLSQLEKLVNERESYMNFIDNFEREFLIKVN